MKASETRFQPIIEGTKQYVVPLFQRAYSWTKKEWDVLWEDLMELCENEEPKYHFIGSLVTMPTTSVPEGVTKYLLIDGQQRLTTFFILLTLLRDLASNQGNPELATEINETMIINRFKKEIDRFKLLPTQADREAFQALVENEAFDDESNIIECYKFFARKASSSNVDVFTLKNILTNRLSVVSIVLEHDDNPHLVFESLNAKGRPLTQSDLIRNYFFMRIHVDDHNQINSDYWQPMQNALGDNLTECIRHYLMRNGSIVKQGDVYFTLKDRFEKKAALQALEEVATFAWYYERLLFPERESNSAISEAISRLNRLEVTTAYPFLLNCYHDFAQNILTADDFLEVLKIIENYVIRRYVCNVPTSQLNKMFPALYAQASKHPNFVQGVRLELQQRGYPKDGEFVSRLKEAKLYGGGERLAKVRLILESLEASFKHKEKVNFSTLTIEHIMPQTATNWWQEHLGEDWETVYELYLHSLGNLTLTGYNSELSNEPYPYKQKYLTSSHVELNQYFAPVNVWNREEIEKRANNLSERALSIWPYFGDVKNNTVTLDNVTGKTPSCVVIMKERRDVSSWRDVLENTLTVISELDEDGFGILVKAYPRFISRENHFRRTKQLRNGYFIELNLSAKDIYRFCLNAVESIGLTSDDWQVETN